MPATVVKERFDFSGGTVEETDAGPVVRNVLLCGLTSLHGYDYLPEVWANGRAKEVYEGVDSYVDHGGRGPRSAKDKIGWFENITQRPDGQPQGDFHLNPEHPLTPSVVWAARHRPTFFAMSHVAPVTYGVRNGRKVVESIDGRARSVDLVDKGGTTGGVFEHAHGEGPVPTVKEYADKLGRRCTVAQLLKLKTLVQEDDYGAAPMMPDAPDAESGETEPEDGIDSAFLAVAMKEIQECMDAKGDPAKLKKCLGRLKKILMTHGELTGDEGDEDEEDEEEEEEDEEEGGKPAAESAPGPGSKGKGTGKKKKKPVARESAPAGPDLATVLTECDAEQFTPSPVVREALLGIPTADRRKQFIREQKGLARASSPRSAGREAVARESAGGDQPTEAEKVRLKMRQLAAENQGAKPPAK